MSGISRTTAFHRMRPYKVIFGHVRPVRHAKVLQFRGSVEPGEIVSPCSKAAWAGRFFSGNLLSAFSSCLIDKVICEKLLEFDGQFDALLVCTWNGSELFCSSRSPSPTKGVGSHKDQATLRSRNGGLHVLFNRWLE